MEHPRRKSWPLPIATAGCRSSGFPAVPLPPGMIGSQTLKNVGQSVLLDPMRPFLVALPGCRLRTRHESAQPLMRRVAGPGGLAGAQLYLDGHPRRPAPAPTCLHRPCGRRGRRPPRSRRLRTGPVGARALCVGHTRTPIRCGCFRSLRRGYADDASVGPESHRQIESSQLRPRFKPVRGSVSQPTTSATALLQEANNIITIIYCK